MSRRTATGPRASTRLVPQLAPLEGRLLPTTDVLTYHQDSLRTGWDSTEAVLNPTDVNPASFGKVFTMPTDARVDAEPLYVAGVEIPGQGVHNVVYVASENDSVYAFDADTGVQLWKVSLLQPGEFAGSPLLGTAIDPEIGVTATPVIDASTGTMYVEAMSELFTSTGSTYRHRLFALSIATGAQVVPFRSIDSSITYPGAGPGGNGSVVIFNPKQYRERSALTLSNGVIYTGWASLGDTPPYTGWVMGFRVSDLSVAYILNIDPNGAPASSFLDDGSGNTFWNSGNGFAVDAQGNLYNISANGPFDPVLDASGFPANGDFGDSILKLTPANGTLAVTDYFTPAAQQTFADSDFDLNSSGIALADIPGPDGVIEHLAISSDKLGNIYVVNRDNLGKFNPAGDFIYQRIPNALGAGLFGSPTVYGGLVYFGAVGQPLKEFGFVNGLLVPLAQSSETFIYPGTTTTVSSNGGSSGIVWATENGPNAGLHAYLATNIADELYNSKQVANGRDLFGTGNKFITPMVANGRVYVGTASGVTAFGLLPTPPPTFAVAPTAGALAVAGDSFLLATLATDAVYPESELAYFWGTLSAPPGASAAFSASGTNAARTTVATVTAAGRYIFQAVVVDPSGNLVDCLTVVDVVAPAASAASAIASASPGVVRPSSAVAAPAPAPAAPASVTRIVAVEGLALAPPAPAPMAVATNAASSAPVPAASVGGRIMLVPQGPAAAATAAVRPLGERRPSARPSARWASV